MIFLTENDKIFLDGFLEAIKADVLREGLEVKPIKLKTGWMLPEVVLTDQRLIKYAEQLDQAGLIAGLTFRDINEDELIKPQWQEQ
jgi:hypothetical protein